MRALTGARAALTLPFKRRIEVLVAAVVVAAIGITIAVAPSAALAATMIGQLSTPNEPCNAPVTVFVPGVASGNSYAVPRAGVITSWSFQDSAAAVAGLKLKVGRTPDGVNYTIVGESAAGPQRSNAVNTYLTRIPVQANDQIGFFATSGVCVTDSNAMGDVVAGVPGDIAVGTTAGLTPLLTATAPLAAIVEPDADQDGFGDETQDQCPTDASTHGPCPRSPPPSPLPNPPSRPPPDTTPPALSASSTTAKLSKRGSISFFVTSIENARGLATGKIVVPKMAKPVRFANRSVILTAGKRTMLTLSLSKKGATVVRKALSKKKKLRAEVTLTVRDAAGNASTKTLSLTLRH